MSYDRINPFWNQQSLPQQNPGYQPVPMGQFNPNNQTWRPDQSFQKFPSAGRGQSGGNPNWRNNPQNPGGQGYSTPGYPPQGFGTLQQSPMPGLQGQQLQGYAPTPQRFNQGHYPDQRGQLPLQPQPAWEEPKKGGIKGFISNLMAKRKR
ncbi:hypothetical protein DP73_11465 [Desulfosporosinus sp. HMP52]|uniref:hypothetical protein n=1 Tax=Desulfosporosinus sp. HMP52 TaxID=1487923 RepID=UPI00051FB0AC|nr:hypothetical protein [Desulfosporosinus sp. HMP52]KGK88998.1 hypothetical protein DP73_11465 [Desulfosporosinus sp. HMP52]